MRGRARVQRCPELRAETRPSQTCPHCGSQVPQPSARGGRLTSSFPGARLSQKPCQESTKQDPYFYSSAAQGCCWASLAWGASGRRGPCSGQEAGKRVSRKRGLDRIGSAFLLLSSALGSVMFSPGMGLTRARCFLVQIVSKTRAIPQALRTTSQNLPRERTLSSR